MHAEVTEIDRPRYDYLLDGVACTGISEGGILPGKKLIKPPEAKRRQFKVRARSTPCKETQRAWRGFRPWDDGVSLGQRRSGIRTN